MKYLLLVAVAPGTEFPEGFDDDALRWMKEMDDRGVRVVGSRLASTADATSVRVRAGEVLITDGPFAETKEQIGGFDILECADLDEALEIVSKHPVATLGVLELRPFREEW